MNIETIEVAGFSGAFTALRLPFGKEPRSRVSLSFYCGNDIIHSTLDVKMSPEDLHLMQTLVRRGTEHAKVTRGIIVWAKITAPVYWWCEMETYVVGHQRLSSESTMHIDCKGLSGEELVKAKSEIPMGKELTKVDFFSYQALRNIVKQRHNHRLPEWHEFVDWVRTLPLADELIFEGLEIWKQTS